jgi:hypothetical protein
MSAYQAFLLGRMAVWATDGITDEDSDRSQQADIRR